MLLWFAACVVAVEQTVTIEQPVDRIVVDVSTGDVKVVARSGPVRLTGAFGGAGHGPISHEVTDGELVVRYDCKLCGGELKIEAPDDVELDLTLGGGDLGVIDMKGATDARLDVGSVDLSYVAAPEWIDVDLGTGDVQIAVPAGGYVLDLATQRGKVDTDGVIDDPNSPYQIAARVTNGSIDVIGE